MKRASCYLFGFISCHYSMVHWATIYQSAFKSLDAVFSHPPDWAWNALPSLQTNPHSSFNTQLSIVSAYCELRDSLLLSTLMIIKTSVQLLSYSLVSNHKQRGGKKFPPHP